MGTVRTAMLLAGLTALFMAVGYFIGGQGGMLIALAVAIAMNAFSYWNSDKMVLRMYGAEQVDARAASTGCSVPASLFALSACPDAGVFFVSPSLMNFFVRSDWQVDLDPTTLPADRETAVRRIIGKRE